MTATLAAMTVDPAFWSGRRVLVTGNTGFKGAWLSLWLTELGADVHGLSAGLLPGPSLHAAARLDDAIAWTRADVRDGAAVARVVRAFRPEVVVHLAAQSLVRRSLTEPRETFETNVIGTLNVLEAARAGGEVRVVVNVTSDKCYENPEDGVARREEDPKGGADPYSASKACAELLAHAYHQSLLSGDPGALRLGSARAGNVIGGGDWAPDRLLPDIVRAAEAGESVAIRNPDAVRPWQHVLNPLSGYLVLAERLWEGAAAPGGWNFGPELHESITVRELAERVAARWPGPLAWSVDPAPHPHEARTLVLDSGKARDLLGWAPLWSLDEALDATVGWYAACAQGGDARAITRAQIADFAAVRA